MLKLVWIHEVGVNILILRIPTTRLEATIRVLAKVEFTLIKLHLKDGERQSFVVARAVCRLFHLFILLLLCHMMPKESLLALNNLFTALLEGHIMARSCDLRFLFYKAALVAS